MLVFLLWKYWRLNREVFVRGVFRYDGTVVLHGPFIIQKYSSLLLFILLRTLHSCLFLKVFALLHSEVLSAQLLNIVRLSVERVFEGSSESD